jgi:hypothetical protein
MQEILSLLESGADLIDMTYNVKKTVAMVFSPVCHKKIVADTFLALSSMML